MKKNGKMKLVVILMSLMMFLFGGCGSSSSSSSNSVKKDNLKKQIETATNLLTSAKPGTAVGQYPQSAIDALNTAKSAATVVNGNDKATQDEVDKAAANLATAIAAFEKAKVTTPPSPERVTLGNTVTTISAFLLTIKVGTEEGQYPQSAVDALKAAIDKANLVLLDPNATTEQIKAATEELNKAFEVFKASIIFKGVAIYIVGGVASQNVPVGTSVADLKLTNTVEVTLTDSTIVVVDVKWITTNYDPTKAGIYTLKGDLIIPAGKNYKNSSGLTASITITVGKIVSGRKYFDDVVVVTKSKISDIIENLVPKTADIDLEGGGTVQATLKWNTSMVDTGVVGSVTLTAELLNLPSNVINPSNFKAELTLRIVDEPVKIYSVVKPKNIITKKGTLWADLKVSNEQEVILNTGAKAKVNVVWDDANYYYPDSVGTHRVYGAIEATEAITNPDEVGITIDVTVNP